MFEGHPKGLWALALANTGERFGYYTMLAVFALFLRENFGLESGAAGAIYSTFLGLVYFMPLVGGFMADKFGFGKMVTIGISVMFVGYLLLSFPLGGDMLAMIVMIASLLLISLGTGLFKGNLQVMVGNLYDDPRYASKRDSGFSLFYMAINIGALFAPTAAVAIKEYAESSLGFTSNDAYHFSFMVACASLVISILIYRMFRSTFSHVEGGASAGKSKAASEVHEELTPAETKQRVIALCLVFAVVIFFWMAFHQNGLTLTYFADEFVTPTASGVDAMPFNVWYLVLIIVAVYATFSIFQSPKAKTKIISGAIASAMLGLLVYFVTTVGDDTVKVSAPIFQHFNPFYVVALTPVSMAIFSSLASKGKEPSAPRKIAYGMLVAAVGFVVMIFGSQGLNTPEEQQKSLAVENAKVFAVDMHAAADSVKVAEIQKGMNDYQSKLTETNKGLFADVYEGVEKQLEAGVKDPETSSIVETKPVTFTSPYWLILTYLVLTFAELLLSPMGISFVSKVAPPKLKGMMMGGWFVATAIGNMLVSVGGFLWAGIPLTYVWLVFIVLCLLSALFMFVMMKRLEKVAK